MNATNFTLVDKTVIGADIFSIAISQIASVTTIPFPPRRQI